MFLISADIMVFTNFKTGYDSRAWEWSTTLVIVASVLHVEQIPEKFQAEKKKNETEPIEPKVENDLATDCNKCFVCYTNNICIVKL